MFHFMNGWQIKIIIMIIMQRLEWQKKAYHVVLIKVIQCAKKYLQSKALNNQYSHAGRLDISAVTAQGIPKFWRAPLMIPHGK